MSFGEKLRILLEEHTMTQKQLAKELNIAPSTVGSYIQNTREPDFDTLKSIAGFFQVSTDYLLDNPTKRWNGAREEELIRIFRAMTGEQQEICLEQCRVFLRLNAQKKKRQ